MAASEPQSARQNAPGRLAAFADVAEPASQKLTIFPQTDTPQLRTWRHRGTSRRLALSFSGVGFDHRASPEYQFSKIASANGRDNVLFIAEPKRSWLNDEGLIEAIVSEAKAFAEEIDAEEIVTLGFSMGAFSALVISSYLPVTSAVALAPQFSDHPEIAGDDPRWMEWRKHIAHHRIRSVADHLVPDTIYHVFHCVGPSEKPQRDRFPIADNLFQVLLPKTGHGMPQRLRGGGVLYETIQLSFNNRVGRVRELLQPLGAYRRTKRLFPMLPPSSELPEKKEARA